MASVADNCNPNQKSPLARSTVTVVCRWGAVDMSVKQCVTGAARDEAERGEVAAVQPRARTPVERGEADAEKPRAGTPAEEATPMIEAIRRAKVVNGRTTPNCDNWQ